MFHTFVQQYDTTIRGYHRSTSIDGHIIVEGLNVEDINSRAIAIGLDFSGSEVNPFGGKHFNPMMEGRGHESWKWTMELSDVQTPKSTTIVYFMDGSVKYSNQNWTA
jgi:hypothetical protein